MHANHQFSYQRKPLFVIILITSLFASFSLGNARAVSALQPAEQLFAPQPSIVIFTSRDNLNMEAGMSTTITYYFTETGGGSGNITAYSSRFYTQYDEPLSDSDGPYSIDISIIPNDTTSWDNTIYLPPEVVENARTAGEYAIVHTTTFYGTSSTGSAFSVVASVTFILPPDAFSKQSPSDGSLVRPASPTLRWESSIGAYEYKYCIDTTNNNHCDLRNWIGTYEVSKILDNLLPNTTYYWQVRAYNITGGSTAANSGAWWSFTTLPAPGTFGKSAPANDHLNLDSTISWSTSTNADAYLYCVDKETINNSICDSSWLSALSATSVSLSGLDPSSSYYWQVRATNSGGTIEADSGTWWKFITPTPPGAFGKSAPANNSLKQPLNPSLSWSPSTDTTEYLYCLDKETTNNSTCDSSWVTALTATSVPLTGLDPATTYYWQVRATGDGGTTYANSGTWWKFTTIPPPGPFGKSTPTINSLKQPLNPSLSWTPSTDTTEYLYCLDKETTNNSTCDSSWVTALTATSVPLSGLDPNSTYYWQVRATGGGGTTDANSGTWWKFTTIPPPGPFGKSTPAINSLKQPLNPTLSWTPSTDTTEYLYCLDKETTNNSTCDSTWNTALTATSVPLSGLDPAATYYWQVRATGGGGTTDANSGTWWKFTTIPPPEPFGKITPTNDSLSPGSTLAWSASTDTTEYLYCLDKEITNNSTCDSLWVTALTATSIPLSGLDPNSTYYWQVRATGGGGTTDADSGTWWKFSTPTPPGAFGKSTPANNSLRQPLNPTLSWSPSTDATEYLYCLDKETVNNDTCDSSWIPSLTATSIPLSGLSPYSTYYWQVQSVNGGVSTDADSGTWWRFTTKPLSATLYSTGTQDGWILESTETSSKGGTLNATGTTFNLGDEAGDKQYRSILSFNTASLPDNAVIIKATLKIKKMGLVGTNPFTILTGLKVDIRKPYFGTTASLVISDFQAAVSRAVVSTFGRIPVSNWYSAVIGSAGYPYVNKTGTTQFRLYFLKDDNDDGNADYMKFYSGNYATVGARPTLILEYYIP